jgi:hypothetical protein
MQRMMTGGAMVLCLGLAACASAAIPAARTGTDELPLRTIDEPCNPANAAFTVPTRMTSFDPLEFPVPTRWVPNFTTINDLDFNLQKTGAVLHVWKGSEFTFWPVLPVNTVECELARGDTTIKIRSTMNVTGITSYRVDVTWEPQIGGQHVYMQLITRFPEHMKQIRGVVEAVRFPERAASAR